jgi:hypothetical protein
MVDQFTNFMKVLEAFDKQGVDYILIGGVAVILYGLQRLTQDIDIFIRMDIKNIEQLRKALYLVFKDPSIEEITLNELNKYPVIRYGTSNGFFIDIISRLGEVANYEDLEYEVIDCQSIKIRVATPESLYKLKKDTIRHKDKVDAIFLKELIEERRG